MVEVSIRSSFQFSRKPVWNVRYRKRVTKLQNEKAERMHQTVMNMVRFMIFVSRLPLSFWEDATEYASCI